MATSARPDKASPCAAEANTDSVSPATFLSDGVDSLGAFFVSLSLV